MTTSDRSWGFWLGVASLSAMGYVIATSGNCALAQIRPDGSLGAENSVVTPTNIDGLPTERIDGGAVRGTNLFHSFEEFSVPTGGAAYFNNALNIQNIISRVTGGSVSNIDGLLRANGTANLFLLNPNGIIFGPNASLDVGGSFVASTASSLNFADGTQFSATAHPKTPLLQVSVPIGLQYGDNAASVQVQGSALEVQTGKTLAFAGGNVRLDGGIMAAPGGRVELGGVAGAGMVGLNGSGNNLSLSFPAPEEVQRADVSLINEAFVSVAAGGGGSIAVNARNLDVLGRSFLSAGIAPGLGSADTQAGDITLNATGTITVAGSSGIFNEVDSGAVGKGGNIDIQAGSLSLLDGAQLSTGTRGQGDAGSVSVRASDSVSIANSLIVSNVRSEAVGKGGNINIQARSLSVTDNRVEPGAGLNTNTYGQGDAGSILIQASDSVSIVNSGMFSANAGDIIDADGEVAVGNGGDINILTGSLSLSNETQVSTSTYGQGDAGSVFIRASGSVLFTSGSFISSNVFSGSLLNVEGASGVLFDIVGPQAVGKGGDITILAESLSLDDAGLATSTWGQGDAGSVFIRASGSVSITNSFIGTDVGSEAVGKGGNIDIQARSLSLTDEAGLTTTTGGQGDAGNVSIQASDSVSLVDSRIFSNNIFGNIVDLANGAEPEVAVGNAGDINILTGSLSLSNETQVSTSTYGQGDAGSVFIRASGPVSFTSGSRISSYVFSGSLLNVEGASGVLYDIVGPQAVGKGGDINIFAESLSLDDARLATSTSAQGDAGSVFIHTSGPVSFTSGSFILSSVASFGFVGIAAPEAVGNAGDINIFAQSLSLDDARLASATAGRGNGGAIFVQTNDSVSLTSDSLISSGVQAGGVGNGGDIDIQTRSLSLANGSAISAGVLSPENNLLGGVGEGGNIRVNATETVNLSGVGTDGSSGGLLTTTNFGAIGQAGDITVNTSALRIADGAVVSARTLNPSDGGNITINANTLEAANGGQVLTTTSDRGQAGNITVNVTDSVTLSGSAPTFDARLAEFGRDIVSNEGSASGLLAGTSGAGTAGDLVIATGQLIVRDGASVSVSSVGFESGDAGDLRVQAHDLLLDSQGKLIASTESGQGGNMTLQVDDLLLLRRNSSISTTAGLAGSGGNGGNITITAPFIVAVPEENSDITGNAYTGKGGRVEITTQGIFGTQFREQLTPESDITASSDFGVNGVVEINKPDIDPSRGLAVLPAELVDASNQITTGCTPSGRQGESKFVLTGRGGLPPTPSDTLSSSAIQVDWVTLNPGVENRSSPPVSTNPTTPDPDPIVEAQGWVINNKGEVVLTATAPTPTPHIPWMPPVSCQATRSF